MSWCAVKTLSITHIFKNKWHTGFKSGLEEGKSFLRSGGGERSWKEGSRKTQGPRMEAGRGYAAR